ncbi:MAG: NUDIX domain-containing protein [Methanomassiliicoccaceae archaeon]|jgi:8-oxo-dGTP diphosphatase|nr:NUDIX domain-containing protein [Methanomassiliicoccaceae archaeon]
MNTVYTVAFSGPLFLMVHSPKRNGWEMPGGKIEEDENIKDAAVREYMEESGHRVRIISMTQMNGCHVCAAFLGEKVKDGEFTTKMFRELPADLSFERSEYYGVLDWARHAVYGHD